ncbi:DUF6431 domain-containing protein [Dehalobacterium formicoaceticum]|jgi:hypothetical protein|uniref:DUF6431 domain-containing protein n=1 Tax=Dehalobacterium formicoaceticum TaxID=51515 RepID=UPI0031F61DCB
MLPHLTAQGPPKSIMIIAYLGRNVKEYREKFLRYLDELELICPGCGEKTVFHATYKRHLHIEDNVEWLTIQRVICKECERTHAVIPDFIRPYKHYSACDSEMSLRDMDNGIPVEQVETSASISTLRRWAVEFREKSHQIAGALKALLFRFYKKVVNEIEFYGLKIFLILERILEEFPEIESNNLVIGDTNILFTSNLSGMFV